MFFFVFPMSSLVFMSSFSFWLTVLPGCFPVVWIVLQGGLHERLRYFLLLDFHMLERWWAFYHFIALDLQMVLEFLVPFHCFFRDVDFSSPNQFLLHVAGDRNRNLIVLARSRHHFSKSRWHRPLLCVEEFWDILGAWRGIVIYSGCWGRSLLSIILHR